MKLTREIQFDPAYDKRDPDPKKSCGIHGVTMRWLLKGSKGVIQFVVYTNWQLKHVQKEEDEKPVYRRSPHLICHPHPADLGYHAYKKQYPEQVLSQKSCQFLGGKPCYYDGSSLAADDLYWTLVEKGGDAVWTELEYIYIRRFDKEVT